MSEGRMFTYQTRVSVDQVHDGALEAYGAVYARVERKLFAKLAAGGSIAKLKPGLMTEYGITARQYNAIAIALRGKIASIKERRSGWIKETELRVEKARKLVAKLSKNEPRSEKLHQKKRRLATQRSRLEAIKADHKTGKTRLCFGTRKLFSAQFDLLANGYTTQAAWRQDWREARSNQFYVIGSKDESGGCQSCVAFLQADGSLTLRLRLPNRLGGKHLVLEGLRFAYGQDKILESLATGRAISYRFKRDEKGWRVLVSTEMAAKESVSNQRVGAIGVDVNSDHWAVSEIDRFGNLIYRGRLACLTEGKASGQTKSIIGQTAKLVVALAVRSGKPVVIEKLNFDKKKSEMEVGGKKANQRLSGFAYAQARQHIHSASFKRGVNVIEVNPAFSSVIGAVNHAHKLGLSTHAAASFVLARRGLGLSERPTVRLARVPGVQNDYVTFSLPARNREKHVWSYWSSVRSKLKAAQRVQDRSRFNLAPWSPQKLTLSANQSLRLQEPHGKRGDNGSPHVINKDLLYE